MVTPLIKLSGTIPVIEVTSFPKKLERVLLREQKNAVRVWARTVAEMIPTYTGTARGTIAGISRTINNLGITNSGGISARARMKIQRGTNIQGVHYKLGFQAGKSHSDSKLTHEISTDAQSYTFLFWENLPYVMWNEMSPAPVWITLPSTPPWKAITAGIVAFDNYVKYEIPKIIRREVPSIKMVRLKG